MPVLVTVAFIVVACDENRPDPTVAEQPFQGLDQLVELSDLSIIGQVTSVSELQRVPRRDHPESQVEYLEATVEVDRSLFGSYYSRVVVHVPVYYLADNGHRMVTKAPILEPGDTVMLFLTQRDSLFDLDGRDFVIAGGGLLWGKLNLEGERVSVPYPESKPGPEPLDEVIVWIEAARFSLAKPGLLAGEVSGLDEGDRATIRLMNLGHSHREENGVLVDEWTLGNGPWEQSGLRLSQGTYHLIPEAEGYLPLHIAGGLMFEVPAEGMDWRERNLSFAFFRPKDASDRPLDTGTGWRPERSVGGRIDAMADGVEATVRIQRLPPVPNELYVVGPPLPEDTQLYYPPELTCLEEIGHLEPEETVAVVEVHNGRWGLSDFALQGNRYLITIEASGLRGNPVGYVAVLFGGTAEHLLRGVDFHVGDSESPDCGTGPQIVEPAVREALRNIAKDPMARIADRVPGFGGAFRDTDRNIVYIYLQDASMQEEAERALTEEFGSDFLAGREVQVLKGDYSMDHLDAWYRTLSGTISQVPGIVYTDLDEGKNRIEIVMYPRRGGREEMEAAIATVDVPRGAVVIDVGCEGKWPRDFGEPPEEAFLQAVEYSLEVVSQAPYGETVEMKLTLWNAGDEPVSFFLGGWPAYDFVVSTPDGEQVWHWMCAKFTLASLNIETLEPREDLEFIGGWEQIDNRGEPVPPGVYSVRAVLNLDPPEKLVTEAHELEVQMPTTADSPPPTATPTPAPMPTPDRDRLEEPPRGPGVEIGTGYPYTLYVHCGIRDARFDGRLWMADPMLSDGSGNPTLDWTAADSRGKMKLVRDDLAVFTAESGRIVEFKLWPLDVEWRPCF